MPDSYHEQPRRPKTLARACLSCRTRKTRCDASQPRCSACAMQDRDCVYRIEPPRKRPTFSRIHELEQEKAALQALIRELKQCNSEARTALLSAAIDDDGGMSLPASQTFQPVTPADSTSVSLSVCAPVSVDDSASSSTPVPYSELVLIPDPVPISENTTTKERSRPSSQYGDEHDPLPDVCDAGLDITNFISVDDVGKTRSYGPSSALHFPAKSGATKTPPRKQSASDLENARNVLISQAALQRQLEHRLSLLTSIDGTPIETAQRLLHIHWARQHHTFLLTYRPAVMRDLQTDGPNCSKFLMNAIFACSTKYSGRIDLRDNPHDPKTAGLRFFRRCDELLHQGSLLMQPTIPTIVGLLLLGSTYNSIGETSKGWLYTGYALRMVYDLGLHLDPDGTTNVPEDIEIRRRVFWGAFICDKLQSLYLGRPMAISLRDSHVSTKLLDTYEENELFYPPNHPAQYASPMPAELFDIASPVPLRSVSTFQQLCHLSRIMTSIIDHFYVVGTTFSNARKSLQVVDSALDRWKRNLDPGLDCSPWDMPRGSRSYAPPNVMILHCIYYSLIVLLHRPFISDGHLRSTDPPVLSWDRCSQAARCLTSIISAFRDAYGLTGAPYVLGYAAYVSCTIHVRNATVQGSSFREDTSQLISTLRALDELCKVNPGLAKPADIIRRLIEVNHLDLNTDEVRHDSESTATINLDAILSMFPVGNSGDGISSASAFHGRSGLDLNLPFDPLFGLMDGVDMSLMMNMPTR